MDEDSKLLPYVVGIGIVLFVITFISGFLNLKNLETILVFLFVYFCLGGLAAIALSLLPPLKILQFNNWMEDYKDSMDKMIIIGYVIALIYLAIAILCNI